MPRVTQRTLATLALVLLVAVSAACNPLPYAQQEQRPPDHGPDVCTPWVMPACDVPAPVVDPDGVLIVGDSITWGVRGYSFPGWQAGHVLEHVRQTPGITRLVVALGTNDARTHGGWNAYDVETWTALLSIVPDTVIVLPALGPGAPPEDVEQVELARQWMMSSGRPVVDWQVYAADPTVVGGDAVHLVDTDYARSVRAAVIDQAAGR